MTLVLKRDLDIVKMSIPKMKVPVSRYSKVVACTDRHTDIQSHRQYLNATFLHMQAVKTQLFTTLNETNIVLQDVGTFYWQISAFKCNFGPICGL